MTSEATNKAKQLTQAGHFQQALDVLEQLGTVDGEGIYIKAVCLRKLNHHDLAIQCLQEILAIDARHARAHQEIGYNHLALRQLSDAIEGFARAVEINPSLLSSWQSLASLYKERGSKPELEEAAHQIRQLRQLPKELLAVKSYLYEGKIEIADQICRQFMQSNKQHVEGLRLLAQIASQALIIDDAEFLLESAVAFEPEHIGARVDYAGILIKRQRFGKAHEIALSLNSEHPDNKQFQSLLAATNLGIGETNTAIAILSELETQSYGLQNTFLSLGHAHKTAGNLQDSIAAYKNLYKHKPDFGDAFWSLANTKTYQFSDNEIAHMLDYVERESTSATDRVHFCFALGKAYEDQKDVAEAFRFYDRGNALNRAELNYQAPEINRRVDRQIAVCNAELFDKKAKLGHSAPDPIFIVGLPRAGSTLLEQILASHSQVDGTLELPNILSLSRRLLGRAPSSVDTEPQYPKILAELDDSYFARFGEQYINDTQVYRQSAPFFVDKMPNNFLHIGLIKLILPNAKIIDARRHPMACCFSGFKQLFAEGQEFTYGLTEIGNYYKAYVEVMDHWDLVLPDFVLRVQHEDVVADLETQLRRMLDFCGLSFEQQCLDYHQTERNIRTPSSEQVRQPIYTSGLEQWKKFDKYLDPLKAALGDEVLSRYPL